MDVFASKVVEPAKAQAAGEAAKRLNAWILPIEHAVETMKTRSGLCRKAVLHKVMAISWKHDET